MNQPSSLRLERPTRHIARITFANPPVTLVIPESVVTLHRIVTELGEDPDVQVVIFDLPEPENRQQMFTTSGVTCVGPGFERPPLRDSPGSDRLEPLPSDTEGR
ncbi:hypothetical protein [Streptomyces microflavus]|uniref:hypothetical protein n=1 Tax=Streptomyces microflavus TaxID=1919 RepID=UPI0033F1F1CD